MRNHLQPVFYGLSDPSRFLRGVQDMVNAINGQAGIYVGDNLVTYHRNLSFLDDVEFMEAFQKHATTPVEKALLWRNYTVYWGVRNGLRLEGDFVECACYKGTTARVICDAIRLGDRPERRYWLYDLFEHDPFFPHHSLPEHGDDLYGRVRERFADLQNVFVIKGKVPDVLAESAPGRIAFLHLDLNNAEAEIGALAVLFDRMVPGAALVLDDYGWLGYRKQKIAEDEFFDRLGRRVLELPTGQGLLIK